MTTFACENVRVHSKFVPMVVVILGIPTRPTDGQLLPKRPALVVHIVATRATEFFGAKAQIEGGLAVGLPPGCAC